MRKILIYLSVLFLLTSCKNEQKIDIEYISQKFNENIKNIDKVQYNVENIITFPDGTVWDNEGFAVIEKEQTDTIFGFSFYGLRNDINKSAIYRKGIGFHISNEEKNYKQEKGSLHFLGRPGGQMIYKDFFKLDTEYKYAEVTENEDSYIINYTFEDNSKYNIIKQEKTLELSKITFLPKKVTVSQQPDFGDKQTTVYVFENLKINEEVDKTITAYISDLNEFELIKDKEPIPNKLLNQPLPQVTLKNLMDENETVEIKTDKLTLIDFWEVWCGACIASFPKVEELKNKFSTNLNVIGIVSEDEENAINLVKKKGTTFLNLIGNKELEKIFSVNSWPRYFLVDEKGIIQKEYHGFSDQIEKDIQKLIKK